MVPVNDLVTVIVNVAAQEDGFRVFRLQDGFHPVLSYSATRNQSVYVRYRNRDTYPFRMVLRPSAHRYDVENERLATLASQFIDLGHDYDLWLPSVCLATFMTINQAFAAFCVT
ncbi:MAG: hypothetical protein ACTS3R_17790 [Inquilinaceae bacterium]